MLPIKRLQDILESRSLFSINLVLPWRNRAMSGNLAAGGSAGEKAMSAIPTTRRLIEAYAESEPWKEHHDRAMLCRDIEELMTWGIHLFRGLCELEANLQSRALARKGEGLGLESAEFERVYRLWVTTSEGVLRLAGDLSEDGFPVDGLDEFRRIAEEARCQIGLWDLEPEIRPIEEVLPLVRPENPRPDRYGA
jgi:hypothetical protein